MILTVAGFKGGVGKTTTAVHLAAFLNQQTPTLLIDGDANRSASRWARRGTLPFKVVDEQQAASYTQDYLHSVIDSEARPDEEDLEALVGGCDLLVIPATPDALALEAVMLTIEALKKLWADQYRVLLTVVPPMPSHDGEEARATLGGLGVPIFKTGIRRFVAFRKAALNGVPVYEAHDARAERAWADYVALGKEILE